MPYGIEKNIIKNDIQLTDLKLLVLKQQKEIEGYQRTIEEMHDIFHALIDEVKRINKE